MADPPRYPGDDTDVRPTSDQPPRAPRWVKVIAIVALILALFFVVRMLVGAGGGHGPGRHPGAASAAGTVAFVAANTGQVRPR